MSKNNSLKVCVAIIFISTLGTSPSSLSPAVVPLDVFSPTAAGVSVSEVQAFLGSLNKQTPGFFTDNPQLIQTPALQILSRKNKQIFEPFAQKRIEAINKLRQEIQDIQQLQFLEELIAQPYVQNEQTAEQELTILSQLKNSGYLRTYYDPESKESREVLPTLRYDQKTPGI